jgi:hypothetical protein
MELKISSSVSPISPSQLFNDGFELSDQTIIPSEDIASSFVPEENRVELFIYDVNVSLLDSVYDYNDWTITQNSDTSGLNNTDTLQLDPSSDLFKRGYDNGDLYAVYNFVNYELTSSPTNQYYISEISSDRTEIRLKSNFISNEDVETSFNDLKLRLDSAEFFDEFYIASDGNNYNIGVNILLDTSEEQYSILIKLYDALPSSFSVKDEIYVATKVAETKAYTVKYYGDLDLGLDDVVYLQGPNYNLEIKDFVNNSTELKSKSELLDATTTGSNNNLQNILNQKGVKITPNYSYDTFNEFVNFSSAKKRIENFYEKVSQIQSYEDEISTINTSITGSTSGSAQVSSSLAIANTNIENIIKNFDGYEYYLYYESGSSAYPKVSGSVFPYQLQNTGSTEVLQWLGSDVEGSANYGGILLSASFYDNNNQNWLYYTIPEFIRDNSDNNNYIEFSNMVGQHFDEIWLYTKAVSEKTNTTNELDKGIPLPLAEDAIKSLGYEGFGNNFNNQNNYIGLIGEEDGSYVPPTGNEIIENYIAINNGSVVNYWAPAYSFLFYVEQLGESGFPYAIDKVSKEIYKRLYHNMAYLVKKKGTVSGLRQLINIWGIPDTILRINEFGGKNKDNSDDYDYWYNRYSYAFTPVANQNVASASAVIPWQPLQRNKIADLQEIVPDSVQFRFKTTGYPSSSYAGEFFTQSLAVKKSDGDPTSTNFDWGIALFYTGSATGSYSGSNDDTYKDWGIMRFYISGSAAEGGTVVSDDIYLPFFNKGWWSVMLQKDVHHEKPDFGNPTYTLYAKNKIYNGNDGNSIGFEGSASIVVSGSTSSSINQRWKDHGFTSDDGVYIGGFVSGSNVGPYTLNEPGKIFSGSFQEFRYYSNEVSEAVFNDFVMNPESIEGNTISGSGSSFDIVCFRAPLGNELESKFSSSISSSYTESLISSHPAVSAMAPNLITASFWNYLTGVTSSNYHIQYYDNTTTRTYSKPNKEVYFLDQPAIGIRNRISNKIQIDDAEDYGNVLSNQISIEQDYEVSRSYTEDITSLEVAFSPQDNLNDDIIQAFGFGVVSDALADPRFTSESLDYYPRLKESAEYFFQKYTEGNIYDYIRLIKYVDASLFKAIKAYVPARTSVSTGIVIKQHMLERNRYAPPSITKDTPVAFTPETGSVDQGTPQQGFNSPFYFEDIQVSASINMNSIQGGTGGTMEQFNYYGPTTTNFFTGNPGSESFGQTSITQSYLDTFDTVVGPQTITQSFQDEFYDGEFSGSTLIVTTQSLLDNPYTPFEGLATYYNTEVTNSLYETAEKDTIIRIYDYDDTNSDDSNVIDIMDNDWLYYKGTGFPPPAGTTAAYYTQTQIPANTNFIQIVRRLTPPVPSLLDNLDYIYQVYRIALSYDDSFGSPDTEKWIDTLNNFTDNPQPEYAWPYNQYVTVGTVTTIGTNIKRQKYNLNTSAPYVAFEFPTTDSWPNKSLRDPVFNNIQFLTYLSTPTTYKTDKIVAGYVSNLPLRPFLNRRFREFTFNYEESWVDLFKINFDSGSTDYYYAPSSRQFIKTYDDGTGPHQPSDWIPYNYSTQGDITASTNVFSNHAVTVGSFDVNRTNAIDALASSPPQARTASLSMYPVTYGDRANDIRTINGLTNNSSYNSGSYLFNSEWAPMVISFNYDAYDPETDSNVNIKETLVNDPSYRVTLNYTSSGNLDGSSFTTLPPDPQNPDKYGLSGQDFDSDLANIVGISGFNTYINFFMDGSGRHNSGSHWFVPASLYE